MTKLARHSSFKILRIQFLALVCVSSFAFDTSSPVAESQSWRALLHFFDSNVSEIRLGSFFLSEQGHQNLKAELQATLDAFHSGRVVGPLGVPALCAFPARRAFLESQGYQFEKINCPDWDRFLSEIKPKGLTLVFSTAYANNPASLFGHTLIRIRSDHLAAEGNPLLDYGLNYSAATPDQEAGYLYIYKGVFGLYEGRFQFAPYYRKVLEYTEAENRDLWEYDLDFTEAESRYWLMHAYELRFLADFKYTFFYQNCSYQLVQSLRVVRPEIKNWYSSPLFYILPGETVRGLVMNGIMKPEPANIHYRPSHYKILFNRLSQLSSHEKKIMSRVIQGIDKIKSLSSIPLLESLNSYYEYLKIQQQEQVKPEITEKLRDIRITRARLGVTPELEKLQHEKTLTSDAQTNRPDLAHAPRTFSIITGGGNLYQNYYGVGASLGLHDLLNRDDGYEANFGVTALATEWVWQASRKKMALKNFKLAEIISLEPKRFEHTSISWKGSLGWQAIEDSAKLQSDTEFYLQAGAGFVFESFSQHLLWGAFFTPSAHVDEGILGDDSFRVSLEPFFLYRFSARAKLMTELQFATTTAFKAVFPSFKSGLAVSSQDYEARFQALYKAKTVISKQEAFGAQLGLTRYW